MVVLRAIGRFFAKIGRWIRDTAWIQPLLIVGGIFAIIFSIPYITRWVGSWFATGNAAVAYYEKKALSWSGIEKGNSQVDDLFKYIENYDQEKTSNSKLYKKFGDKFLVSFVQEECTGCEDNYNGFKTAQSNWKNYTTTEKYKLFTIFIDKESSDENETEPNYFKKYILGVENTVRYNEIFEVFSNIETNYTTNNNLDVESKFVDSFTSPTTLLFDFNFTPEQGDFYNEAAKDYGLSEVFFDVDGSTNYEKARFIWGCWNHSDAFSKKGE